MTYLKYSILNTSECRNSQAKTQVYFQDDFQAKFFTVELHPGDAVVPQLDHAVLVAGGEQVLVDRPHLEDNLVHYYAML